MDAEVNIIKRNKIRKQRILVSIAAILTIAAGLAGCGQGKQQKQEKSEYQETVSEEDKGAVTYNGKKYRYNDHLSNFLFLGIDTREKVHTEKGRADAGQADAVFLFPGTE